MGLLINSFPDGPLSRRRWCHLCLHPVFPPSVKLTEFFFFLRLRWGNIEVNKCFFSFPDCHLEQLEIQLWLVTVFPLLSVFYHWVALITLISPVIYRLKIGRRKKKSNIKMIKKKKKRKKKTLNKCSVFHSVLSVTHYYCPGFPYYCTLFFVTTADRLLMNCL